jgi:hypothetical protein
MFGLWEVKMVKKSGQRASLTVLFCIPPFKFRFVTSQSSQSVRRSVTDFDSILFIHSNILSRLLVQLLLCDSAILVTRARSFLFLNTKTTVKSKAKALASHKST